MVVETEIDSRAPDPGGYSGRQSRVWSPRCTCATDVAQRFISSRKRNPARAMLCGCLWVWVWALATLARVTAGASSAHACFAERSDEHRLDGQWVSSRGKAPPYAECTDVLGNSKNHKCERTTEGRFYTKQVRVVAREA